MRVYAVFMHQYEYADRAEDTEELFVSKRAAIDYIEKKEGIIKRGENDWRIPGWEDQYFTIIEYTLWVDEDCTQPLSQAAVHRH